MKGNALVLTSPQGEVAIFSHGGYAMSLFEPDTGRIIDVNDAWVAQYGYSRDEARGMVVAQVSAEPDETRAAMARAIVTGGERVDVRWHRRKDGTVFPVELTSGTIRVGERTRMYAVLVDITDRLAAAAALQRSEASFRSLIEGSPEGVIVHRHGVVVYVNPAALALLGHASADALVGKYALELVHPDDRAKVVERVRALLVEGTAPPMIEERLMRADGSAVEVEVTAILLAFDGAPAVCAMVRDTSARKRMEAQLLMADRLASLGRLAASVGHEINNPLAYVLGNIDLMRRDLAGAAADAPPGVIASLGARLSVIEEGAARVRDIVRDLKTLSVSETRFVGPTDLRRVLDVCANMAENEIRQRARLVRDYGEPVFVSANEARLGQVFLNLLINAGQAIPEGDPDDNEVRLVVRRLDDGHVTVEVRDTGTGIPAEIADRLFEPFVTTKTPGTGTGLGLSICQMIVTSLGGTIEVGPNAPRGAAFVVTLPRVDDLAGAAAPAPPSATADRLHVLLVDDEPLLASALAMQLDGWEVTVKHNGRETIEVLSRFADFDAIVLDVFMPDGGGIDVYEHLRTRHPGAESRVVFMTGGAFTPRVRALLDAVPNPCLEKPFDVAALRRAVRGVLAAAPARPRGARGN